MAKAAPVPYTCPMLTEPIQLDHGPGPKLAFVPTPAPDQLAITAVALANTDGGAIVLGLDENGGYHGPLDGSTVARILREAAAQCIPAMPLSTPEIISTPGGPALAVRVPRGRGVHASWCGDCSATACWTAMKSGGLSPRAATASSKPKSSPARESPILTRRCWPTTCWPWRSGRAEAGRYHSRSPGHRRRAAALWARTGALAPPEWRAVRALRRALRSKRARGV